MRILHSHVVQACLFRIKLNNVVADECDHVVLDKAALCMGIYSTSVTSQRCVYHKLMLQRK